MRRHVKAIAVAAKTLGVAPSPGDGARHLFGHRHEIAVGLAGIGEIDNHRVRAGADDRFGDKRGLGRAAAEPGSAVDEDVDRAPLLVLPPAAEGMLAR